MSIHTFAAIKKEQHCRQRTGKIDISPCSVLAAVLHITGLRIVEALNIDMKNLSSIGWLTVKCVKGSADRIFRLPWWLLEDMHKICYASTKPFKNITYKKFYRFCIKNYTTEFFFKNKKKYSITHAFRKHKIRERYIESREKLEDIVSDFGWRNKESILYYL